MNGGGGRGGTHPGSCRCPSLSAPGRAARQSEGNCGSQRCLAAAAVSGGHLQAVYLRCLQQRLGAWASCLPPAGAAHLLRKACEAAECELSGALDNNNTNDGNKPTAHRRCAQPPAASMRPHPLRKAGEAAEREPCCIHNSDDAVNGAPGAARRLCKHNLRGETMNLGNSRASTFCRRVCACGLPLKFHERTAVGTPYPHLCQHNLAHHRNFRHTCAMNSISRWWYVRIVSSLSFSRSMRSASSMPSRSTKMGWPCSFWVRLIMLLC